MLDFKRKLKRLTHLIFRILYSSSEEIMVLSMKYYETVREQRSSYKPKETNDCTVIATAIVTGCGYRRAHKTIASFGREDGGTFFYRVHVEEIMNQLGCEIKFLAEPKTIKSFLRSARTNSAIDNVAKILPTNNTYILFVRGHVAAVKDGQLQDWTNGRKHRVIAIARVKTKQ